MIDLLDRRPILVAIAGPNGAGKSTFYEAHLRYAALPFINADQVAMELALDAYRAAEFAGALRRELLERGESFIFETVFSDPIGDKLAFLKEAERRGYTVIVFFIGLDSPKTSDDRVAIRVAQGGHDVPREKVVSRYARVLENLRAALTELRNVRIYDNSNLDDPFRLIAVREDGQELRTIEPLPAWFRRVLRSC